MKQLFLAICLLATTITFAQSEKYMNAMGNTLNEFKDAKTSEEFKAVAQKFERIAEVDKDQWLPYYYAALVKSIMCITMLEKDVDGLADNANATLDKAEALSPNNSEIYCVRSLIATAKLIVNPQARYMEYGPMIDKFLEKAIAADASNPRPYYIQASNLVNTPEQYGGGCSPAKPLAEKALALYNSFKPASAIHPTWGKETTEQILNKCK